MEDKYSANFRAATAEKPFYKWEVLALLWFAFFLNQADRQIYNTLLSPISHSLGLSTAQAGLIATLFSLVFAVLTPISGVLSDRCSRRKILVFSILLWSFATVFSGACTGLVSFIIFRSVATGMGEAFFGPANYATIADYHGNRTRARAMSIHHTSYYFGVIVSGAVAGWVADRWGWRSAFYIFGSVGVLFGFLLAWRLKDKRRECDADTEKSAAGQSAGCVEKVSFWEQLGVLFKVKTALCLTLSFSSLIFVLQGYLTWSTWYLVEKFGLSSAVAGFDAMFYTHIAAFVGILAAGWLSDFVAVKSPRNRILLQSLGLLFAAPFIVAMGLSTTMTAVYIGFAGFGFFRAFFDANTYSVLYDVIPKKFHASASGVMVSIGFGVGAFSPWILGCVEPLLGLSTSIAALSVVWVVFAALQFAAYLFFYESDRKAARAADFQD